MLVRWYVKHGLAGYGPDLDEEDEPSEEPEFEISSLLERDAESAEELAHSLADDGRFEDAWREHARSEELANIAANFNPDRASAPLYVDNAPLWRETVARMIGETFPLDVSESERLYVWEANEEDEPVRPDEHDGYVNEPAYGSCVVSLDGRNIGQAPDVEGAFRILANRMREGNYFPNVWHVNERGNTTLVSLDVETGSYVFTDTGYV